MSELDHLLLSSPILGERYGNGGDSLQLAGLSSRTGVTGLIVT
jgi:hypothetical protein